MQKLWLIRQTKNKGYDTYDSAVVAAYDEQTARHTHPDNFSFFSGPHDSWAFPGSTITLHPQNWSWVQPSDVIVEYLGETDRDISGVIIASFNAGQ
jgi:hypothetical protein